MLCVGTYRQSVQET